MPKPTVTADSRQYDPGVTLPADRSIAGESTADWRGWNPLSYLCGSENSNDMGCDGGYTGVYGMAQASPGDWEARWDARRRLQRYTLEQGSSTASK